MMLRCARAPRINLDLVEVGKWVRILAACCQYVCGKKVGSLLIGQYISDISAFLVGCSSRQKLGHVLPG